MSRDGPEGAESPLMPGAGPVSIGCSTSADVYALSRRKSRLVGSEPEYEGGNFFGLSDASERDPLDHVLDLLWRELLQYWCVNHSRRDCIDVDSIGGNFLGQSLGQANHASLRGRIRDHVRVAFFAGNRCYVDDAARAARLHPANHGLRAQVDAFQVHIHHVIP